MICLIPFVPWIFDNIILAPTHPDFPLYRLFDKIAGIGSLLPDEALSETDFTIINYQLSSQFFTHMSTAMWLAVLLATPYIIYELWRFICPALYDNERRVLGPTFLFGSIMFYIGCTVGYFIIFPLTLRFLYTYQLSAVIINQLSLQSYMDNFLMITLLMGIVFELPVVAVILSRLGLLTRDFFARYRRHAIVAILVCAAIITPTADPFTLMAVFIPVYILWEISALLIPTTKTSSTDN